MTRYEKYKEYIITYQEKNSEELKEYRRKYYKEYYKDPERKKKKNKSMNDYYHRNKEKFARRMKEYHLKKRVEKMNQLIADL